jgi:hypothetical protein
LEYGTKEKKLWRGTFNGDISEERRRGARIREGEKDVEGVMVHLLV